MYKLIKKYTLYIIMFQFEWKTYFSYIILVNLTTMVVE